MTDKELLNKIKQSAEQIDLPDALAPETISARLRKKKAIRRTFSFSPKKAASAAAILLFCGILSGTAFQLGQPPSEPSPKPEASAEKRTSANQAEPKDSKKEDVSSIQKKDAGSLYKVAKNYEEIYEKLKSASEAVQESYYYKEESAAAGEESLDGAMSFGFAEDLASEAKKSESVSKNEASKDTSDHSSTNLQTEGVDESDIIKTDGRYIYTVSNRKVIISDTAKNDLTFTHTIDPELDSADSVQELYVDGDRLILIAQRYQTSLEKKYVEQEPSTFSTEETDDADSGFLPLESCAKVRSVRTDSSTMLYVYDIANPARPLLIGTGTQDGFYHTSRKIGDILYLFTEKDSLSQSVSYETKSEEGGIIPCVNGTEIPSDHVYLPSSGDNGLVISSIKTDAPEKAIDEVMIVHNYVQIYVGNDSIYLYGPDDNSLESITQIAKFEMHDGIINAVNAESVKGRITDTFAINEYNHALRVLTTSYDDMGTSRNYLYLFDENMKLASSLDDIAVGEEIYAARYLGDTAYFITYRNTDPLFAADLSDIRNPKLLGELKITGFSEYLHFWGHDKLLGIGYETDPESGEQKGIKLVMFDISNPTDLKTIDAMVLSDYYNSPALYDYKCVLADPEKNLIGFAAEYHPAKHGYLKDYLVFSWEKDRFSKKLNERLSEYAIPDFVRGIYIDNRFYIASPKEISGFDMKQQFQKKWHLKLEES